LARATTTITAEHSTVALKIGPYRSLFVSGVPAAQEF
jgi:hypothetical protein